MDTVSIFDIINAVLGHQYSRFALWCSPHRSTSTTSSVDLCSGLVYIINKVDELDVHLDMSNMKYQNKFVAMYEVPKVVKLFE